MTTPRLVTEVGGEHRGGGDIDIHNINIDPHLPSLASAELESVADHPLIDAVMQSLTNRATVYSGRTRINLDVVRVAVSCQVVPLDDGRQPCTV